MKWPASSECLFPFAFLSQAPLKQRWEFELFDAFFVEVPDSNVSEFLEAVSIAKPISLISDSPVWPGTEINRRNQLVAVSRSELIFQNNFMAFRYLHVLCPFYSGEGGKFSFDLRIESSKENEDNWGLRAEEAINRIMTNDQVAKVSLSERVKSESEFTYTIELRPNEIKALTMDQVRLLNISSEEEVVHSLFLEREGRPMIWVEDLEARLDYDLKHDFGRGVLVLRNSSVLREVGLRFSTLSALLRLNLDTSVDQATSLLANFIGLLLFGFYNIFLKVKGACASKKRAKPAEHVKLVEQETRGTRPVDSVSLSKSSGLEDSQPQTSSRSNEDGRVHFEAGDFQLPEALRNR